MNYQKIIEWFQLGCKLPYKNLLEKYVNGIYNAIRMYLYVYENRNNHISHLTRIEYVLNCIEAEYSDEKEQPIDYVRDEVSKLMILAYKKFKEEHQDLVIEFGQGFYSIRYYQIIADFHKLVDIDLPTQRFFYVNEYEKCLQSLTPPFLRELFELTYRMIVGNIHIKWTHFINDLSILIRLFTNMSYESDDGEIIHDYITDTRFWDLLINGLYVRSIDKYITIENFV